MSAFKSNTIEEIDDVIFPRPYYLPIIHDANMFALLSHRHTRPCMQLSALGLHILSHGASTS